MARRQKRSSELFRLYNIASVFIIELSRHYAHLNLPSGFNLIRACRTRVNLIQCRVRVALDTIAASHCTCFISSRRKYRRFVTTNVSYVASCSFLATIIIILCVDVTAFVACLLIVETRVCARITKCKCFARVFIAASLYRLIYRIPIKFCFLFFFSHYV